MTSHLVNEIEPESTQHCTDSDVETHDASSEIDHASWDAAEQYTTAPAAERKSIVGQAFRFLVAVGSVVCLAAICWFVGKNIHGDQPFEFSLASIWPAANSPHPADENQDASAALLDGNEPHSNKPAGMTTSVKTFVLSSSNSFVTRSFTGTLNPTQASDLGFNRPGMIKEVLVDQGDSVKKGDVLVVLDTKQLQADIAVLNAERDVQKARQQELVAGPRKQKIESARSRLKELEALQEQAQLTYDRLAKLVADNAVALQEVENAKKQLEASQNRVDAQRQATNELLAGTRPEQLDAQAALMKQLEAKIQSVQVKLAESKITAPFDGIVSLRNVDDGAIVLPGSIVMRLVEAKPPEAWIGIPTNLAGKLSADKPYVLTSEGRKLEGKLKSVLPELDSMTRTQTAIFTLDSDSPTTSGDAPVSPAFGQIIRLEVPMKTAIDGFWIPRMALSQNANGTWAVFAVDAVEDAQGKWLANRQPVTIVRVDSDQVLVQGEGLKSNDRIVAAAVHKLTPGQRIHPIDIGGPQLSTINN